MERNDIIRMAREAGLAQWSEFAQADAFLFAMPDRIERFAALVAAEKDKEIANVMRTYEERAQAYLEVAKKMRDESRPDVLESERAANAKLTEELEKAELLVAEKDKQIAFLKDSHDAIRELAYKTGVEAEREACERIAMGEASSGSSYGWPECAYVIAKAIRARGEK